MQKYSIGNAFIHLEVSDLGAELQSLYGKETHREYLWQADARYWGRSSPILFPFIGELKDSSYMYRGTRYKMPKHGFARDTYFELLGHEEDYIQFRLQSNAELYKIYPFKFEFIITYRLAGKRVFCEYEIMNKGNRVMYFNLGVHPAFQLPKPASNGGETWTLCFDKDRDLDRYYLTDGLVSNHSTRVDLSDGKLALSSDMFAKDAWVMKRLKSKSVKLESEAGNYALELACDDFSNLGLWAVKDLPFICIEPWSGYNDLVNSNGNIEGKEAILSLEPSQLMKKTWSVNIIK